MTTVNKLKAIKVNADKTPIGIYGDTIESYDYFNLVEKGEKKVGIHARINRLVIIDVDVPSASHKHNGMPLWKEIVAGDASFRTCTVTTPSGGFHCYYKLPDYINADVFSPPGQLGLGVDVKFNGYVIAPPTNGYHFLEGMTFDDIVEAPQRLLDTFRDVKSGHNLTNVSDVGVEFVAHQPFTKDQIEKIRYAATFFQDKVALNRDEWRDGLFSINAGLQNDIELRNELGVLWTMNQSYQAGDDELAIAMMDKAKVHQGIGPGTVLDIINQKLASLGAAMPQTDKKPVDIMDDLGIDYHFDKVGNLRIDFSESNLEDIIGKVYEEKDLFIDIRKDMTIFEGRPVDPTEVVQKCVKILQTNKGGFGFGSKVKSSVVRNAVDMLLGRDSRKVDPHYDYLNGLEWDGVERIDGFFANYAGAEESEYVSQVSKNFWISLAARGLRPGTKVDSMVVLEGLEGVRKSSLVKAIGGDHSYAPINRKAFTDGEELKKMHQAVIVELPELIGLKGVDSNQAKGFLTTTMDKVRGLYKRSAQDMPRGFILIGTTNDKSYLNMDMGMRRFWPIEIQEGKIVDTNAILTDRDQLFAEAVFRYRKGESFYDVDESFLKDIVRDRVMVDPIMPVIESGYGSHTKVYAHHVMDNLLERKHFQGGASFQNHDRIIKCLTALGFEKKRGGAWERPSHVDLETFV